MKQYHIETKNQVTGQWNLYERFKCRYRLGYVASRFVVVNQADAELEAACNAIKLANHVNRKRRVAGSSVVAFIETRITEVTLDPNVGRSVKLIWQNGAFGQKARTYGAHTA